MPVELVLQPIQVWISSSEREGRLAMAGGRLLALLVKLEEDDGDAGKWFLEIGFGPAAARSMMFDALPDAENWLRERAASLTN